MFRVRKVLPVAESRSMWCVIPAAGKGTRIASLARAHPKTLLEVHGRSLLDHLISGIEGAVSGVCIIIPSPHEGGAVMRRAINSFDLSIPVETVTQADRMGVADAVWRCRDVVDGPFVVIMGDVFFDPPLAPHIAALDPARLPAVLVEPAVKATKDPAGVVAVEDGRVTAIEKRPLRRSDEFRVAGAFAFSPDVFAVFDSARPDLGEFELEDVVDVLLQQRTVSAVVYDGWRRNVNTPSDLRAVRERMSPDHSR